MTNQFPVQNRETIPAASNAAFDSATAAFGFVPNLIGVMGASSALADSYLTLANNFETKTSLNATERQIVLLTVSRYHECHYCMAAHSMIADMQQVPLTIVEAIRNDQPIADAAAGTGAAEGS